MTAMAGLLFEGPLGRMRVEDVLQFVAQSGLRAHVEFATEDRVHGWPRAVDLVLDEGRVVGLGPRGSGLRLGDLAIARGAISRRALEALAASGPLPDAAASPPVRLGERLVAAGLLAGETVEELLWERHARVVWGLLAWDRGSFTVAALEPGAFGGATAVDPPLPVDALLLDGLQRAESALADDLFDDRAESDPGRS